MFSKFNVVEIIVDGLKLIKGESKIISLILFYAVFPLVTGTVLLCFNISIDRDIISDIISSISLFSGLLFSVLFILIGNYEKRKNSITSMNPNDEEQKYIERYKKFTTNTTTLILYSIIIAIITIFMLFTFNIIGKGEIKMSDYYYLKMLQEIITTLFNKSYLMKILQVIAFGLLFNYVVTILIILKEVYAMIYDDINS